MKHNLRRHGLLILLFPCAVLTANGVFAETPTADNRLAGVSVSVGLDKGVVDVKSTRGQMKHFRETTAETMSDFEAFKKEAEDGVRSEKEAFNRYKENIQREFVGYVESVTLKSGTELVIADNVAVERKTTGDDENPARDFMQRWRTEEP